VRGFRWSGLWTAWGTGKPSRAARRHQEQCEGHGHEQGKRDASLHPSDQGQDGLPGLVGEVRPTGDDFS